MKREYSHTRFIALTPALQGLRRRGGDLAFIVVQDSAKW